MSQFSFEVRYIKGEDNVVVDAMSRGPYPASQASGDVFMHESLQDCEEMDVILSDEQQGGGSNCSGCTRGGRI